MIMEDNLKIEFVKGKKVRHVYTKKYLWMLKQGHEQILCRTEDLGEVWFYPEELEDIVEEVVEVEEVSLRG